MTPFYQASGRQWMLTGPVGLPLPASTDITAYELKQAVILAVHRHAAYDPKKGQLEWEWITLKPEESYELYWFPDDHTTTVDTGVRLIQQPKFLELTAAWPTDPSLTL